MANEEHLKILKQGVEQWNKWRLENAIGPDLGNTNLSGAFLNGADLSGAELTGVDLSDARLGHANLSGAHLNRAYLRRAYLSGANLSGANLSDANLSDANLSGANLSKAELFEADLRGAYLLGADLRGANLSKAKLGGATPIRANLSGAHLTGADLRGARLFEADLSDADLVGAELIGAELISAKLGGAHLSGANLSDADLQGANLTGADLTDADLSRTGLVETDFTNATITGCRTYGASAWNVTLVGTVQDNLVISKQGEPIVTVDNLEVGQFIYLMLNNTKIRDVINTITSKGVLILGRFSDPQRKSVLDGLREKLREYDLLPMVFDFDRPTDKDYTETVQTLAGMSMFVIADLTNPKSTPLELEATVKQSKIPYIPIIDISVDPHPFAMLVDLQKSFHWVLPTLNYESKEDLLDDENLKTYVIDRAVAKREELRKAKNQEPEPPLICKKKTSIPHDK
jgi:uncharacterized protein YjbI with pentapeptide repeats